MAFVTFENVGKVYKTGDVEGTGHCTTSVSRSKRVRSALW